jgi:hypothetical protein
MRGKYAAARVTGSRTWRLAFAWMLTLALIVQGMAAAQHVHAEPIGTEGALAQPAAVGLAAADQPLDHHEHKPDGSHQHRDCPACLVAAAGLHVLLAVAIIDWPPPGDNQPAIDQRQHPRPSTPRDSRTIRGPPTELNA